MTLDEAIKTLPHILEQLKKLDYIMDELEYLTPDLTKRSGVAQYLKRSEKTIDNYLKNNTFVLNYHYYKKDGKIFFVEDKIKEFRREYRSKKHFTLINSFQKVN